MVPNGLKSHSRASLSFPPRTPPGPGLAGQCGLLWAKPCGLVVLRSCYVFVATLQCWACALARGQGC